MARSKSKFQVDDPLAAIPSYVKTPEGVFNDIEHYRTVAERITKALAASRQRRSSNSSSSGSSLYEGIQIEFSTQYTDEEIYLDAFASKIVLRAPKRKGESAASLQARRMHYFEQLLRPAEAMKTIGIAQIYLSLKDEGRKKISKKSARSRRT
jgi:hypothetical protein